MAKGKHSSIRSSRAQSNPASSTARDYQKIQSYKAIKSKPVTEESGPSVEPEARGRYATRSRSTMKDDSKPKEVVIGTGKQGGVRFAWVAEPIPEGQEHATQLVPRHPAEARDRSMDEEEQVHLQLSQELRPDDPQTPREKSSEVDPQLDDEHLGDVQEHGEGEGYEGGKGNKDEEEEGEEEEEDEEDEHGEYEAGVLENEEAEDRILERGQDVGLSDDGT
ncbi:hypothetical protein AAF712_014111 [Marasmius tenuissimus]|uniref:Uncharacterized protein n=1 Tax=Marasmius tenuissimus TaxID=585030 RepID=A0ABR2ZC67_9AGAR